MDQPRDETGATPRLGLVDTVSLVVGIIVGVGIFQTPPSVFREAPQVGPALLAWFAGGLLALVGAFCFAELAAAYPHSGGEYVYLTRAFGRWVGFVYAWIQLSLIRPASIGAMAYVFALYADGLLGTESPALVRGLTIGVVWAVTLVNLLGVALGKNVQNLLTAAKVLGLTVVIGIGVGHGNASNLRIEGPLQPAWFAQAMIVVLWTYAGWHEAAYVASEVRDGPRTLPASLILGTLIVTVVYLLVNLALAMALGPVAATSSTAAADLASLAWPTHGKALMSGLILVSALGALNGAVFTTARIGCAFAADHAVFAPLGRWSRRFNTPARALVVEALVTTALMVGVFCFGPALNLATAQGANPFDDLIYVTSAAFWVLFLLTGAAYFALRWREPDRPRPFRAPFYPLLPAAFCATCVYMLVGAIREYPLHSLVGLGIGLTGLPLYFLPARVRRR